MSREKITRNVQIFEMREKNKKSFRQIAEFFGVNVKTVYRAWKRNKKRQSVDNVGISRTNEGT
jgi:DNA invertase Pin-like site-specific DNA recombinase